MIFNPNQINELMGILERYTLTFVAKHVGTNILTKQEIGLLKSSGIDISKIVSNTSKIQQAFKFGLLSDAIGNKNAKNMTYEGFKEFLETGKFIELTPLENRALTSLKYQTYSDINKLSSKMKSDISNQLVIADKKNHTIKHSKRVTDIARRTIEHRKGVSHMASELGHMTQNWNKDLGRISDYVMHTAFDEGRAAGFQKRSLGKDPLVYKDVYPGACKHCTKHYLTGGVGSIPKIFKLSELKDNGTNVGKKVNEWLPTIPPIHPWCRCTLERLPFGFTEKGLVNGEWEWVGNSFIRTSKEKERKRKKIKITVNGKESFV